MNPVTSAINVLNDRLVLAEAIGQAMEAAADQDNPPPWVYVYREQVRAISEASEVLETLLRGDGGYAPHGGTDDDASGSIPRATQMPSPGASCVS